MIKGLQRRLAISFFIATSSILVIASLIIMFEIHYHFEMAQKETSGSHHLHTINFHLEKAMLSSIVWTFIGSLFLVFIVSYFVAKKLSNPLVQMRHAAERMANGHWETRIHMKNKDEISELADSFNHLAQQLEKQDRLRKNMTADIAHELRTPLATLKSHMEAFEDGIWDPTRERLGSCTEEINRLIHLVSDLEQLNSMEAPEFELHLERVPIENVINQSMDAVYSAFIRKDITLSKERIKDVCVYMDQQRMIQVLINLLMNGLKYTPPGGKVTVTTEEKGRSILIAVRDNGSGMNDESIERAFERFYREDPSRNRQSGGSGIGLAIVKRLVEAHGGQVGIDSKLKDGTTVYVQLPISDQDSFTSSS
ncbi:sensor histidine kinase [Pseudalkalibacillus salsuginis]|uniref:sensor histidine kinase n=1 Tax=Pseudalkalibacillus salsuginis TaxID=2910972 RepID=UPI001F4528F2|nr:ATP-binding protein [Pseudalkalibacillus salsuginis]MCF6411753.1 ATP-binding protein [Pseudalkalibacillus salsuginis]